MWCGSLLVCVCSVGPSEHNVRPAQTTAFGAIATACSAAAGGPSTASWTVVQGTPIAVAPAWRELDEFLGAAVVPLESGAAVTRSALERMAMAAELLSGDPEVADIAAWLAAGAPGSLWEHLGHPNGWTFSARQSAVLGERNRLLRELGIPPAQLARELRQYHTHVWPSCRSATSCPHPCGSREAAF